MYIMFCHNIIHIYHCVILIVFILLILCCLSTLSGDLFPGQFYCLMLAVNGLRERERDQCLKSGSIANK